MQCFGLLSYTENGQQALVKTDFFEKKFNRLFVNRLKKEVFYSSSFTSLLSFLISIIRSEGIAGAIYYFPVALYHQVM